MNPGTAFIDGDWCLDIHPLVGNRETKTMVIDNIIHMVDNYRKCSACQMVVLVWLMDDLRVYQSIIDGISNLQMEIKSVTLICDKENLHTRWKNDKVNEWRIDKWFEISLNLLLYFETLDNCIDTSNLSIGKIARTIML